MRTHLNKALLATAALTLLTIAACHKNETETKQEEEVIFPKPIEVSKENVLGAYLITKVETVASGQRSDVTDYWFKSYVGECALDDITEFKLDNSFIVRDGRIECDESTNDTGTWSVVSKTQLKLDSDTAKIEAFNETTLRIVSPFYSSAQGDVIFTYTRQ